MSKFEEIKHKLACEYAMLEDETIEEQEKVNKVILITSALCAGLAVQPLPFADIAILTPVQGFMIMKIGNIKGFDLSRERAREIIVELVGVAGMGYIAQQFVLGLYKVGLPFAGGFFTIPLVFGLTYAMGKVANYYFDQRRAGQPLDKNMARKIWVAAFNEGKVLGKNRESDLRKGGNSC